MEEKHPQEWYTRASYKEKYDGKDAIAEGLLSVPKQVGNRSLILFGQATGPKDVWVERRTHATEVTFQAKLDNGRALWHQDQLRDAWDRQM